MARLVACMVRAHWNPEHMAKVGRAYQTRYGRSLAGRLASETSGHYSKLLQAMCA